MFLGRGCVGASACRSEEGSGVSLSWPRCEEFSQVSPGSPREKVLIEQIRAGNAEAWAEFIRRYEGRLLAFLEPRVSERATAEDLVQETFTGFLISLPHYDETRSLESWLFAIAAHKLTDYLRQHRRQEGSLDALEGDAVPTPQARERGPSTIVASRDRRHKEEALLAEAIGAELSSLKARGEWLRISCLELLFLGGKPNKEVAQILHVSEQQVANWKWDFLNRLRKRLGGQPKGTVFPDSGTAGG